MIALYPGTFDPITNGHFEIIRRASTIFQVLIVGVAVSEDKTPLFDHDKRLTMVNEVLNGFSNIEVQPYDGLTIDFAKQIEADYYSLSVLAPYYGTELYDQLIKNGHALDKQPWEYFFHQSPKPMVNDKISKKVLQEYLNLSELNNKTKGRRGYI